MRRGLAAGALVTVLVIGATACASVTGGTPIPAAAPTGAAGAAVMAEPTPPAPGAATESTPSPAAANAPAAPTAGASGAGSAPEPPPAADPPVDPTPAADPAPPLDPTPAADPVPAADPSVADPAAAPDEPVAEPPNWIDASDADIRAAAQDAVRVTERFWSESFAARVAAGASTAAWSPPRLWNGDGFYDSDTGSVADCGDGKNYVGNAFFCGNATTGTGFLAWDLQFFHQHMDLGRTMVDMVIAHETGHAVQARLVHDGVEGALFDGSRRYELQADCLGGAALGAAVRDGYLTLPATAPDEMLRVAEAFGGDPAGHGSPEQRNDSFQRGLAGGDLAACLTDSGA